MRESLKILCPRLVFLSSLLFVLLTIASMSSCGVGPKVGPYQAHAVAAKGWQKSATIVPSLSVSASRKLTDAVDAGIQLKVYPGLSAWLTYRFIHDPHGFAFAGSVGVFAGGGRYNARGAYAGPIVSYKSGGWVLAAAARAHRMFYDPAAAEFGTFGIDEQGPRITTDELEEYYSIDLTAAYSWKNRVTALLGVRCADDQSEERPDHVYGTTTACLPVLGISVN